jgi:hypothetical protein
VLKELLRSLSVQQRGSEDRSDRNTSALDAWAPPTDGRITHNMRVRHCRHGGSLTNLPSPCNRLPTLTSLAKQRDELALIRGLGVHAVLARGAGDNCLILVLTWKVECFHY